MNHPDLGIVPLLESQWRIGISFDPSPYEDRKFLTKLHKAGKRLETGTKVLYIVRSDAATRRVALPKA